jgi:hypothetical protein
MTMLPCSNTAPMASSLDDPKGLHAGHIYSAVFTIHPGTPWFTAVSGADIGLKVVQYVTALIFLTKLVYSFLRIRLDPAADVNK